MYVCVSPKNIKFYVSAEPYSSDCHGGAMKMYHCAVLEKTRQILVERRTVSVIATGHELSVEVSSKEPDRNRRNFFRPGDAGSRDHPLTGEGS